MKKGNIIIKNASEIVTSSGFKAKSGKQMSDPKLIKNGALVIEDGIILAVGKSDEIAARFSEDGCQVIDASGRAVLPGFIDPHTHFLFGGYRADEFHWRLRGDSYMDIMKRGGGILSTVRATRESSREELVRNGLKRLDTMLSQGVTTVEGKSGYGLDRDTEIKTLEVMKELDALHPIDVVPTFLGAHAVPGEFKGRGEEYIDFIIQSVLPEVADKRLAEFCDVFCEEGVFSIEQSRKLLLKAKEMGLKLKLHADEIVRLGGAELAAELGAVSADHLLQVSDRGITVMADKGVVAGLLPGTAFCLREPYARARHMIDSGCAVALATDLNAGTFFSESVSLVFALATLYMDMNTEEALTALTINAAASLGRAESSGSIDTNKRGDVIILEYPSYRFLPYHTGMSSVEKVIKNGVVVYDREEHRSSST